MGARAKPRGVARVTARSVRCFLLKPAWWFSARGQAQSQVWEDATCHKATEAVAVAPTPVRLPAATPEASAPRACAPPDTAALEAKRRREGQPLLATARESPCTKTQCSRGRIK